MTGRSGEAYRVLVTRLLLAAGRGRPLVTFLDEVTQTLLDVTGAGALVVRLEQSAPGVRSRAIRAKGAPFRFVTDRPQPASPPGSGDEAPPERLCRALLAGRTGPSPGFTRRGSFWSEDVRAERQVLVPGEGPLDLAAWADSGGFRSLALLPVRTDGQTHGLLQLISERAGRFDEDDVAYFEDVATALALSIAHHRVHWALQERVKELTCLYGLSRITAGHDAPLDDLLPRIAAVIPPGWQYPDRCAARIEIDGQAHASAGFTPAGARQVAEVVAGGANGHRATVRGRVEVVYTTPMPEMDEGPFLAEERSLVNEIARQLALLVERRDAAAERVRLEAQLRHADRLATLGKMTAGAAHELNEPLGGILGFAELALRGVPEGSRAASDVGRIVRATLHAREIVKKLMFFGRQTPPRQEVIDLNAAAEEALVFLAGRLADQRVEVVRAFGTPPPRVLGDRAQLQQVVVNLVVNAFQALSEDGGTLTVATASEPAWGVLQVSDTGIGMAAEILGQIFDPFFTTKDPGHGTGLGLSVVHGIVTAHRGTIEVDSAPGRGARFVVRLPVTGPGAADERTDTR